MRRNLLAVLLAVTLVFASVSTQAGFTGPLTVGLSRALTYGLTQIEDEGSVTYLLNAIGFNTGSTAQTLTAPDSVLALDWEGTLTDFGGAVNASGDSVAPPVGSRISFDPSEGAVLGSEAYNGVNCISFRNETNATTLISPADGAVVTVETTIVSASQYAVKVESNTTPTSGARFTIDLNNYLPAGRYRATFNARHVGAGGNWYIGPALGSLPDASLRVTFTSSDTTYTEHVIDFDYVNGGLDTFTAREVSATNDGGLYVDNLSFRLISPTVLDTDTSSNPLHPSVTTGGVTDYVFYPTHEVSTAYASDKFVWAEASDGSTRYYSSSGGTSAASAPTFPTSGTVVDNDITWTYEGRYGLSGQRVEAAATNYLLNSDAPSTQTTGSLGTGTYACWIEDGDTGTATVSAGTATITGGGAASDGSDLTFEVTGAGTVTVTVAGTVTFFQLEGGSFRTSHIVTVGSTITRSAVNLTIPTSETGLTAEEGAGRMIVTPLASGQGIKYLFDSRLDGDNELRISTSDTSITLTKEIESSVVSVPVTYTHTVGTQLVADWKYGSDGMALNVWILGDTVGTPATNASTTGAGLATTLQIGARLNSAHFNATYDSVKFYPNAAAASADLDDWSLNSIWGYDTDDFGRLIPADADVIYGQAYAEAA